MKVLGLVGSGRKDGNTNHLIETILEGARSSGHITKKIHLSEMTILPIGDCTVCWKIGYCQIEDDFNPLMQEVLFHDCVIFGTPVYWLGPSAQMKTFLDRWVCKINLEGDSFRNKMRGKKCLIATPHQDEKLTGAEYLFSIMERTFEYMEMAYLGKIQTVAWRRSEVSKDKTAQKYAFELGSRLLELQYIRRATGAVTFNFSNQTDASEQSGA